ncbi:lysophospholipid acyltransferase family protein [Glutamicibacter sp. 287]|uniref:lysophospholipid acyltransferase family protein n=1 Tax=unclassified Glutamicibacter TaxID=2627139 RepID=UPI0020D1667A|nr:lysophospholipid acyltransferase family protein [Glutamicibacter sp. BW80]
MTDNLVHRETAKTKTVFAILAGVVRPAMNVLMGKTWKDFDKLPSGGFILCPNHLTEIDPLVVGHAIYSSGRLPRWLAKESLFKVPVLGAALRATGQIPVSRSGANAADSLSAAKRVLEAGGVIVIYPEGTLTRDPELWPMVGRTGAARLALQTGAPVVPMAHWGDQELFPRYAKKMYPFPRKHVTLSVGEQVQLDDLRSGPRTRSVLQVATERIMASITELQAELRQQTPPEKLWNPAEHGQTATGREFDAPQPPND